MQIALALLGVLVIAATLAMVAVSPLVGASGRIARRRLGITLSRAVAGQVWLTRDRAGVQTLLEESVGEGGLAGAAVYDLHGHLEARAGILMLRASMHPPRHDGHVIAGEVLSVSVLLPGRGVFAAETSLAPGPAERAVPALIVLYTGSAGLLALVVVYLLLTRWIIRPVESLTRAAERVAAGRRDVRAETRGAIEVVGAADAFNRMTEQLAARESELNARVQELERTTRELRRAQDQVARGERLATVGRLAAGIAHEVGNPLAAIVGLSDVLADGGMEESETREFATRIGREAQRIHRTVRELLDYARAAPTSEVAAPEVAATGDVADAAEQVSRLLRPQKSLKDIALHIEPGGDLFAVGVSNDRLVQVLLNLVLNAADAIHGAEVGAAITLRARAEGDRLVVEVQDDGPGVPESLRDKVFEPFFTTKPAGEGTGLGLSISAAIIEQAGGTIRFADRDDGARGTRVVIELPRPGVRVNRETLV
jgi:two-component system NtrC family sensor kinase